MPGVGVVIPTHNEADRLPLLLSDLAELPAVGEVVVVDGGSSDATRAIAAAAGVRVIETPPGRGRQMRVGAQAVAGEWLCFLHADVRMPRPARDALVAAAADPSCDAAVWRLAIDAAGWPFRVLEWGAAQRDRLAGLPYGDQGLLVRRTVYEAVGGHPPVALMEDVALVRALRRAVRVRRLAAPLVVSARRWEREGPLRSWVRNGVLLLAYLAGADPDRLARWYRPEGVTRLR